MHYSNALLLCRPIYLDRYRRKSGLGVTSCVLTAEHPSAFRGGRDTDHGTNIPYWHISKPHARRISPTTIGKQTTCHKPAVAALCAIRTVNRFFLHMDLALPSHTPLDTISHLLQLINQHHVRQGLNNNWRAASAQHPFQRSEERKPALSMPVIAVHPYWQPAMGLIRSDLPAKIELHVQGGSISNRRPRPLSLRQCKRGTQILSNVRAPAG